MNEKELKMIKQTFLVTVNHLVGGSNPPRGANKINKLQKSHKMNLAFGFPLGFPQLFW